MRSFFHIVVLLMGLLVVGCQSPSDNSTATADGAEVPATPETETTVEEASTVSVVLNANLATEAELVGTGLSADLVAAILAQRPFLTINDLDVLLGSPENKDELYRQIFVPVNLNTTAEEDFKMIPGVGDRMAHEFEEYRPYTNLEQFRREIGKYVDEEEVARYEQYVFVPIELNSASEEAIKALPGVGDRMAHEFEEYRPYSSMAQFRQEIGKYVDDKELSRLERFVYLAE